MKRKLFLYTLILFGAALGSADRAAAVELISNGDFETGDLTGWSSSGSGLGNGFAINDGSFDPAGPSGPLAPIAGSFDVVSSQNGFGLNLLTESFVIPTGVASATISWSDRIRNFGLLYSDPNQEFRVLLRDAAGVEIAEVYSTDPGDPLQQVGPNARSFDVTALAQSLEGQSIMLAFEQQDSLFFFNVTVDDVSFDVTPIPEPSAAVLFAAGALLVARRLRRP